MPPLSWKSSDVGLQRHWQGVRVLQRFEEALGLPPPVSPRVSLLAPLLAPWRSVGARWCPLRILYNSVESLLFHEACLDQFPHPPLQAQPVCSEETLWRGATVPWLATPFRALTCVPAPSLVSAPPPHFISLVALASLWVDLVHASSVLSVSLLGFSASPLCPGAWDRPDTRHTLPATE